MSDLDGANLKRVLDELGPLDRAALFDIVGLREMGLIPHRQRRAGVITDDMLRRASGLFDDEKHP